MPIVSRINIFPVKSCDALSCSEASVLPSGALRYDRQFAMVDSTGRFINAKRIPAIHRLKLLVDPIRREYELSQRNQSNVLRGHLDENGQQLSDWLSDFFALDVSIVENAEIGFPDDTLSPGPTVVSVATLQTVCTWFSGLSLDEVRRRFRANIEIDGVEPFWEDRLCRLDKQPQPFRIGKVLFGGINPCQRCVVPTRDQLTGDVTPAEFAKQFRSLREQTLPDWSPREHFDHFYRLSTNTRRLDQGEGMIRVGDLVEL